MTIKPEGAKLLVKPDEVSEKTDGGIYLPDSTKDDEKFSTVRGEVVAIGPAVDAIFNDGNLKLGDRITYAKFSGVFIKEGGLEYRLINDDDVLAKLS